MTKKLNMLLKFKKSINLKMNITMSKKCKLMQNASTSSADRRICDFRKKGEKCGCCAYRISEYMFSPYPDWVYRRSTCFYGFKTDDNNKWIKHPISVRKNMCSKNVRCLPSPLLACYRIDFLPLLLLSFIAWKDYYDSTCCLIYDSTGYIKPAIFNPLNDLPE